MFRKINDPAYQQYSPIIIGFVTSFCIYLGLGLYEAAHVRYFAGAKYQGIFVIVFAMLLQNLSRRVLLIRVFQAITMVTVAVVHLVLLWSIISKGQGWGKNTSFAIMIAAIALASFFSVLNASNRWKKMGLTMPHGFVGVLNTQTGIVDPKISPKPIQQAVVQTENRFGFLRGILPLIAGITMFLVNVLSTSALTVGLALVTFVVGFFGVMGFMGAVFSVVSIIRWEKHNDLKIIVQ